MPLASQKPYTQLYVGPAPPAATVSGPMATTRPATAGQRRAPTDRRRGHRTRSTPRPLRPLSPAPRPSGAYRPSGAPHGRGHAAAGLAAAPCSCPRCPASPASRGSKPRLPSLLHSFSPPHSCLSPPRRTRCGDAIAARGELARRRLGLPPPRASRARLAVLHRPRQPSASAFASYAPSTRAAARHRAPTRPAVGSPFRATPAPPLYHRRLPHLTAHLTRPSSPPLGARAAEAGSRRRLRARAAAAPVQVAAPPLLSATGDEAWGKRTPADGNTSPDPVGFKTGHHAAGAAPPSSLPARGSPPAEGLLEGSSKQWVGCLVIPLRHVSAYAFPSRSFAFVVMHIDLASELSTQELPMIKKPDNKLNPKQEDDVSPSAYQIMIKDDYGGLEVILDVYFPLHVTSL
ncbi:LOW QUALITY PROTEIN: hypothetical protein U9M48_015759 [Paspalum notatum var. saurae]|uniref:Uncharacterized protein n=2 Tax=Paspalum notatum var. saurae TaxID=547442 RepID=A0AAQ3T4U4_PASNO